MFIIVINIIALLAVVWLLNGMRGNIEKLQRELNEIHRKHAMIEAHITRVCPYKMPDKLVSEIADYEMYWEKHSPFELSYIQAIMDQESECWPEAVGSSGERGLIQVMPRNFTAYGKGSFVDWRDTFTCGMMMLRERYWKAKGDLYKTAMFYNGGYGIFYQAPEVILKAKQYADAVTRRQARIKVEYEEG